MDSCECCKALWIKFKLKTDLNLCSGKAEALIYVDPSDNKRQFWQGDDPDPNNSGFDVYNLETKYTSGTKTYQFQGVVGDVGLATLDDSDPEKPRYRIVYMKSEKTYILRRCPDPTNPSANNITIRVWNDLQSHIGEVIKLKDGYCYKIEKDTSGDCGESTTVVPSYCKLPICVEITKFYYGCKQCNGCWKLTRQTDCSGSPDQTIYSRSDLSAYEGKWVKLVGEDEGYCWKVELADDYCTSPVDVEVKQFYYTCPACETPCYTYVNCNNGDDTIVLNFDIAGFFDESINDCFINQRTIKYKGVCRRLKSTMPATTCGEDYPNEPVKYPDCTECPCYRLTPCSGGGSTIDVNSATGPNGPLDLSDYLYQIVRLVDGICYKVSKSPTCADSINVNVLEAYPIGPPDEECKYCVVYTLAKCPDFAETITTYADLTDYYSDGDSAILKEEGTGYCWKVINTTGSFSGSVPFVVKDSYSTCETCQETKKFTLQNDCHSGGCESDSSGPEIVTNTDLTESVGKYIKYNGICYKVLDIETTEDAIPIEDYSVGFDTCEECNAAPVTATKKVLVDMIIGPDGKSWVKKFENWSFVDGLLIGACPEEETIHGEDCPDSSGSSSGI